MRTRSSLRLVRLDPFEDLRQLLFGGHLHPEVVHVRRDHELVLRRQQVEELTQRPGVEDEGISLLRAVVPLGPSEDLGEEVQERGPALIVHDLGIDADRHVVDPRGERRRAHEDSPGWTITLLGISPRASRSMAVHHLTEWNVVGFDQGLERQRATVEQVHRRLEPFVVVVVGPDDLELEDDHAVLVEAGWFEPGPDDHEGARIVELPEALPRPRWRGPSIRRPPRTARRPAGSWVAPACRA